jgi:hypothetical protein
MFRFKPLLRLSLLLAVLLAALVAAPSPAYALICMSDRDCPAADLCCLICQGCPKQCLTPVGGHCPFIGAPAALRPLTSL